MKVRYRPGLAVLFLFLGGLLLVITLWLTSEALPMLFLGPLLLMYGALFLFRPYFWVHEESIVVVALFGPPVRRTFEYQALRIEDGAVYAVAGDGGRTKVPIKRWVANRSDWRATIEG